MVSLRCAVLLCCVLAVLINYSNQEGVKRRIHRKRGRQRTSAAPLLSTAESQRQTNVARRNPNGVSASISRQSSQSQSQSQSQSNTRQQQVRRRLPNNLLSPASSALSRSGGATRNNNNNVPDDVISKPADRKIVCYYTNWSQYRPGVGKFLPENIDPLMCTHVIFAFSSMKNNRLVPFEHNDLTKDDKPGLYERVVSLKQRNPRLKVLLAVGGWTFGTAKFKQMTSNRYNRRTFVLGVAEYLRSLGFDGLDLDWEYPKGSQDKQNLAHLASELAEAFVEEASQSSSDRLLLTAAVPVGPDNIRGGYDVPSLARSLDFFNIMSYDYHGKWESQAGHNAPLNAPSSDSKWRQQLSVNASVALWMKLGVPANKIVLGMPTYGRSFTLSNPANSEVNAATSGGGKAGKYTKEAGFLAYYEICEMLRSGAVYRWHEEMSVPIMIDKSLWVGFDDERSIRLKMAFIRDRQLAGAMVWSIDMDDFTGGVCGGAKYPLITAMREELLGVPRDDNKADVDWSTVTSASSSNTASQLTVLSAQPSLESFTTADLLALLKLKGSAVDVKVLEKLQAALARSSSSSLTPSLAASLPLAANTELNDNTAAPVVFCSVASWSSTRAGIGRFSPSKLPASLCTHIVWTFGRIINGRLSLPIGSDSTEASENQDNVADAASLQQSDYQQMIELRRQNPHLKLILSVGGWQAGPEPFQRLSQSNYRMDNFIYQTVDFLRSVKMDGLDIDWEYPSGPLERDAYSRLVREFRLAFDAEASAKKTSRLLLTISLPANEEAMRAGYDVREIAKHADFMNIMSFDFHGGWEAVVGHNAPLFALQKPPASLSQPYTQNVKASVESWLAAGLPNHRTVLGVATYGRSFTLNNTAQYDIGAAVIGPGKQARYTREPGFISYYEICEFLSRDNTTLIWDSEQMVPFAINSDQWIGFDDERSLTSKVEWLREKQLAGPLVWSADLDDFDGVACSVASSSSAVDDATTSANYPLTRAVVEALDGYRTQRVYTGVGQETNANSASATDPNEVVCANSDGEVTFHRDSLDCKHYYLCQGTVRHHMPCPSNLVFNEQESVCDWPENVEACWAFTQAPPTS